VLSRRLQFLQLGGGLAVGLCCLVLGAMSFLASFADHRRVDSALDAYRRFETITAAVGAVVAERAPVNVLIASEDGDKAKLEAVRQSRLETDRLLGQADRLFEGAEGVGSENRYIIDDIASRLRVGRRLLDSYVELPPAERTGKALRPAIEEMFEAANVAEILRERAAQAVLRIAPEVSVEVFLAVAVGAFRDQAGRLGSYTMMVQRGGAKDALLINQLQVTSGRLAASRRILRTLASNFADGSVLTRKLLQIERQYFDTALPAVLAVAAGAGVERPKNPSELATSYAGSLTTIDGLRFDVAAYSERRLEQIASSAASRAIIAGTLSALVCLILLATILIFRRALFAPLMMARQELIAIASGDLSEPKLIGRVRGEMGEMLAGLNAIRDDQRWRRELEEQQSEMARKLKELAETDMLTGLLNRRALEEVAARTLARADTDGQTIALLLFDVDHFKSINDTYGHAAGDEVLRTIAREIRPMLRPQDVFARFGGEEFLILLPGIEAAEASRFAARLRAQLPQLVKIPDPARRLTASFGLALREPGDGPSWEAFVATADRRLYTAKRAGRDRVCEADTALAVVA
jgi:diguanylate cyclase (GGDEF)-like protein